MRKPALGRRGVIVGIVAAILVIGSVVVVAVPSTRLAAQLAWCDLTGTGCPGPPYSPPEEPGDDVDWRISLSPLEAATWGNYYALGDSYSSGDGADDYLSGTAVSGGCWRSANAYPRIIADSFDFAGELGFVACSGQRGYAMLDSLGGADSQLDRVSRHASLVTIGIGGNDLGFTSVLKACMLRVPLLESDACIGQEEDIDQRMRTFESTFEDVIGEVRERAPDARVVVLGYPRLFAAKPDGMYYTLTATDQRWLNTTIQRFNRQIREAAEAADAEIADAGQVGSVEFVDVYDVVSGHEVGTEEPWVNGVLLRDLTEGVTIDRSTFHPTAEGQRAVSERVLAQIEAGPERRLYATRETVRNASPEVLAAEAD
ncbi:SGNH/GDSL hydrolase family protein [Marinitenerispora sediminis]|uniref:Lipase n=1 Tax=Marinitenerispora sediminis TaxID=1931232 RepID=A0A368T8P5_9ACTN|nr:SGNH/GDSL hydrolase family protein [Marinitenerispora sediminis]RCV53513.1 lipase [Marinitenerispora sediminis]RCV57671.1 lipase [Marinitenerispora sediminis]RCV60774.1 lipase [Marinitenerispora sediminis]